MRIETVRRVSVATLIGGALFAALTVGGVLIAQALHPGQPDQVVSIGAGFALIGGLLWGCILNLS